jgi:hypothetical protein
VRSGELRALDPLVPDLSLAPVAEA